MPELYNALSHDPTIIKCPPGTILKPEWDLIPCRESRAFIDVWVTPPKAEKWLNSNYNNRPLISSIIEHYARMIRSKQWKLNGENIKFDCDLRLLDGQHRLYAAIEANGPFLTDIRCGLDRDVFDTIDTGRKRTSSDILHLAGEKNTNVLASAVSWLWRLQKRLVTSSVRPSSVELRQLLEANTGLRVSVAEVGRLRSFTSASLAAALHYLFMHKDPEKATEFFDRLADGVGLKEDSPIYLLRERLQSNRVSKMHLPMPEVAALFIKAWNSCRNERKVRSLRWRKEEDFPDIQ